MNNLDLFQKESLEKNSTFCNVQAWTYDMDFLSADIGLE